MAPTRAFTRATGGLQAFTKQKVVKPIVTKVSKSELVLASLHWRCDCPCVMSPLCEPLSER